MNEYFMSFVIKQANKNGIGGHYDTGYGYVACSASKGKKIADIVNSMVEASADHHGVEQKQIHVIQFNKI